MGKTEACATLDQQVRVRVQIQINDQNMHTTATIVAIVEGVPLTKDRGPDRQFSKTI